jgi:dihydroorotase-like cyclic amidohydrolase
MAFAGVDLACAIEMTSLRPARLAGLPGSGLEVGSPADLIVFDMPEQPGRPLAIRSTWHRGIVSWTGQTAVSES